MIVFDLQCHDGGETFEAWFRSSTDFEEQRKAGLVQCPVCQSANVGKAPMEVGRTVIDDQNCSHLLRDQIGRKSNGLRIWVVGKIGINDHGRIESISSHITVE